MNNKDRLIIIALIFFAFLVCLMAYMTDRDIDAVHKTLEAILEQQEEQATQSTKALNDVASEIESRLDTIEHNQEVQDIRLDNHYSKIQENDSKIQKIEKQRTELTEERMSGTRSGQRYNLSEYEIQLLAKLVYCEVGNCSYRLKKAVASVVINQAKRYGLSIRGAIYRDGAFSTSYKVARTRASKSCIQAVRDVARNGTTLPRSVIAFRSGHYHSFGRRYCRIENVYFSSM